MCYYLSFLRARSAERTSGSERRVHHHLTWSTPNFVPGTSYMYIHIHIEVDYSCVDFCAYVNLNISRDLTFIQMFIKERKLSLGLVKSVTTIRFDAMIYAVTWIISLYILGNTQRIHCKIERFEFVGYVKSPSPEIYEMLDCSKITTLILTDIHPRESSALIDYAHKHGIKHVKLMVSVLRRNIRSVTRR